MKVVINACFGGFGLSEAAYEKLIEWGIPVRQYVEQERGEDGLFKPQPANESEVIFDRELTPFNPDDRMQVIYREARERGDRVFGGRYWDTWIDDARDHPLLVRVVEELGNAASGGCADLRIVEIPDGTNYIIEEYDGNEHIAEAHRTWS
jgi:hypothetical protein